MAAVCSPSQPLSNEPLLRSCFPSLMTVGLWGHGEHIFMEHLVSDCLTSDPGHKLDSLRDLWELASFLASHELFTAPLSGWPSPVDRSTGEVVVVVVSTLSADSCWHKDLQRGLKLVVYHRIVGACYKGCDCLSDIKYINCSSGNFTTLVSNIARNTEYLDLSRNLLTVLPLDSLGRLWRLRVLLLRENNISLVSDGAFSHLLGLRRLDLSHNRLSTLGEGFSTGLGTLMELLLSHNSLTVLESGSFQNLDNLQKLDLSANLIHLVYPRALGSMTALRRLHLEGNRLASLGPDLFSTLRSLEVLGLRGNQVSSTEAGVFTPLSRLALLDLGHNRLSTLGFRTLLSIRTASLHVLLEGNPWHCDCDLQRVFSKLNAVHRLFLDDLGALRCSDPPELRGRSMGDVEAELCVGETVTVLILTITVVITVVAAIIMAEKNKKNSKEWTEESVGLEAYCDN
ncbi:insulin-like growth factor-binding protein complex acid labile subunit [Hypomesus transpacificus]|uniref:insulin-like growth factor-binding protein complex acid labile subunit n=1 Tax=Hypomesus transpacificus TaxID=137520 RepID=UPI001F0787D1|nr:insulin-like growth factor-binding protein complex acid labile subunit [Hypomesus transpacificus]